MLRILAQSDAAICEPIHRKSPLKLSISVSEMDHIGIITAEFRRMIGTEG
jgi:hypothetical protein